MTAHKILLADDSATIRKVVELTFADEGFEVISVGDGDSAMSKFVETQPDMVIADVNMPGMNGYRICEMIKADEATRHIPVILLVGSFEPFDPGEASRVGANYYFTKPFHSIRDLVEKVTEYLDLGTGSETMAPETADIENLYNQSFEDTLELPDAKQDEEPAAAEPATPPGDVPQDTHQFETAHGLEQAAAAGAASDEIRDVPDDNVRPFSVESFRTTEPGLGEPSSPRETEVPASFSEKESVHVSVSPELGDAGMDDNIIETSHPGEPEVAGTPEFMPNPFDERVADAETVAEVEKDASMAKFDWTGDEPISNEADNLRFTVEEDASSAAAASEVLHFAPREESDDAGQTASAANISPELIETIVRSVIERMSDRAVRDVAQEAVPRIAEKLIREALDEENKK